MKILLNKRYWCHAGESIVVERIEAEFKSNGLVIAETSGSYIKINKKGQKILYEELKKRFKKP